MLTWWKNFSAKKLDSNQDYISKVNKPVFIIGCARSGTTLLFQLLRRHSDLIATTGYPDGEDHEGWVKHGECKISGLGHSDKNQGPTGGFFCLHMDENDVNQNLINNMHTYYTRDVLKNNNDKRVINKCPHISNKLRYVREIFPDAKFIHIVRDCLPVISSWLVMIEEHKDLALYWPNNDYPCFWISPVNSNVDRIKHFRNEPRIFPGGDLEYLVDYWNKTNTNIQKQLTDTPEQLITIRYEDLCIDPDKTMSSILNFCELNNQDLSTLDDYGRPTKVRNSKYHEILGNEQISTLLEKADVVRRQYGYIDDK